MSIVADILATVLLAVWAAHYGYKHGRKSILEELSKEEARR